MTDDAAGPEFIFNTPEVEGPREPLYEFLGAASGPGFIDWRPEWYGVYEEIYFNLMRAGMPTVRRARNWRKSSATSPGGRMSASASRPSSIRTGSRWI